jgi:hypothetical protein
MRTRLTIALIALALLAAACGGDDAAPTTNAGGTTGAGSGEGLSCATILSLDDVAALFGEPAVLDAEASEEDPAAGTVSCVWSSEESPDDLEDLQVQLFQIQVYRGEEYYAPEISFDEFEEIEGIGDAAFFSPQLGVSTGFRDGDRVAFLTFSVIGMGDAPDSITKKDQVIALLRLVHDRVV